MLYKFNSIISISAKNSEEARKQINFLLKSLDLRLEKLENIDQQRTLTQNSALHKWLTMLAEELKDKSVPVEMLLKKSIELEWTMELLKIFWRQIQEKEFGEKSTTKLKRGKQIDLIYDILNRFLIENCKDYPIQIPPFPSIQSMEENAINNLKNYDRNN